MLGYGGYPLPYGCAFGVIADMVRRANRESRAAGQARAPPQGREDQVREACRHDCQWFVSDLGLGNDACADIVALVHGLCATMALLNCYQPRRPQIPMPIPSRLACWRPLSTTCRSRSTTFTCATRTTEFLVYVCWARSWCHSLAHSLTRFLAAAILCSWHHLGKVLRMRVELLAIDDSPVRNSCRAISTNSKFEEVLARDSDKLIYKVRCLAEFAECDVTEKVIRRCSRPC